MKRFLFLVFIIALALVGSGRSYYNTVDNGFGGLFPHPGMQMKGRYKAISGDVLVEENASMGNAVTIDTMMITARSYRYQLRLANLNNKQGKTRSIKNPFTGANTTITSPQWGLIFNSDESGNYCAVVMSCDNSTPYDDITDRRTMLVTLVQRIEGEVQELARVTLDRGVAMEDGFNNLSVDVDGSSVNVAIGKDELQQVIEATVPRAAGPVQVGYLVGPGSRVALERAVLTTGDAMAATGGIASSAPCWTREQLDSLFATSTDPNEGYWRYLDRDMQDEWLLMGGRYTLALVATAGGYDILYIDGGRVNRSMWQVGMVKGHMTKTSFTGNFDLDWIDATMEPLGDEDAWATIENGVILTLNYPLYKSQVRYSRVLSPGQ